MVRSYRPTGLSTKDRKDYVREYLRAWRKRNPERNRRIWKRYNAKQAKLRKVRKTERCPREYLTDSEYRSRFSAQDGRCAICQELMLLHIRLAHLDHNHKTGQIRSFLCSKCNNGLGFFQENPDLLRAAALYLERHLIKDNMPHVTDPLRIPESCYLHAEGNLTPYVTPILFREFHDSDDRERFGQFVARNNVQVALDPASEFAYSVLDYERWLREEGRL